MPNGKGPEFGPGNDPDSFVAELEDIMGRLNRATIRVTLDVAKRAVKSLTEKLEASNEEALAEFDGTERPEDPGPKAA